MYSAIMAAFFVAIIFTGIALLVFKNKVPWGKSWAVFLVFFLALWTVSLYVRATGPVYYGVAWLPIIFAATLLLLLFLALPISTARDDTQSDVTPPKRSGNNFYWIMIIVFVLAILIGMMNPQEAL